jgi:serine/threonine protein kinase
MADLTGKTLGNYRVLERIGRGGMAVVYKAYQPALERYVAIKVIHEQLVADDDAFLKRFRREARSVAALRHPNVVQVFDFGIEDDVAYMVMEYLDGITLKARLKELAVEGASMPLEEVQRVFACVASAVDYAHRQGVVHRDLKPANVMLTDKGDVVLADFGIARIVGATQYTVTGAFTGTPDYMSPEQCKGERGDERSDVYALGVMLYEMLTGQVPFGADTPWAVIQKHINEPLPLPRQANPAVPESAQLVVLKALEKDPVIRYQRVADMADGLAAALTEKPFPVTLRPASLPQEIYQGEALSTEAQRKGSRRHWIAIALGAVGVGLIALTCVIVGTRFLWPRFGPQATSGPARPVTTTTGARTPLVPTSTPVPTAQPVPLPEDGRYLYAVQGGEILMPAQTWEESLERIDLSEAEIVADPKDIYGQVARLSVRGYGHGERTTSVALLLDVPSGADIVSIPLATGLNGPVDETDSESGIEIAVHEPVSEQTVWTYASHMLETAWRVPYIHAFADVSDFWGQQVELNIILRQADVCAGAACTHDADLYVGDLLYVQLPDICTTQADGRFELYDYYEDPTPHHVGDCREPQPYYYVDVREGPYNAYGEGEDTHTFSFELPEGAEVLDFRVYYGRYATSLAINDHTFDSLEVHTAFPVRLGTYVNLPEPSRYLPVNDNPGVVAPHVVVGLNAITMTVHAREPWEARPFDLYARFRVPRSRSGAPRP